MSHNPVRRLIGREMKCGDRIKFLAGSRGAVCAPFDESLAMIQNPPPNKMPDASRTRH
jgi:hypothetical protein